MKLKNFLTAMLLVLCAAVCLSAQTQPQPADRNEETNLETQLYLIIGTNQDVDNAKLPTVLESVVKELRATLPFKNYRLATTMINRVKNGGRLDLSWVGGTLSTAIGSASNTTPSFSQFKVREVKLVRNADNQPVVQMLGFNFGARIPIQTATGAIAANGAVAATVAYENTGVSTDISMRESEPVIVGTLNIGPSGDAVILVVAARRTEK
jgi:hypothetical protein